ncbi:DEAD-box ATP-dependent RNA helicase DeaD (= CshA) [hydrothermal vent metagenome]|uniref:DEAD-box ATP-dependent RNA helicase DeaD (= CshA) n=1 Tax=hydrothermal vent metagenome TaxID=652676 RepID=A0A3B0U2K5_9ZZZZ
MKFEELDISDELLDAIIDMGFEETTPIQELAIPEILKGNDLIACAQTGTGKTAAFLLPVLEFIHNRQSKETNTLIIVPTRELAIQIDQHIQGLAYPLNITSIPIYGGGDGDDWGQQKIALTQGADIIVATPGKLISHLNMGYVKFDKIEHLILDEADRMLDIGFHDDILKIISFLPKKRQNLMFSATMPQKIRAFASKILNNPFEINISISKPAEGVLQAAYLIYDKQKIDLINNLLTDKPDYKSILVFSSSKRKVREIVSSLKKNKFSVEGISSDLLQNEREEVLLKFKSKQTRILVATDVLSRGIDIKDINLIINFDVPHDAEDYVHRVGRTARADTTGVALTFVNEDDMFKFHRIEQLIEKEIIKLPLPQGLGDAPEWNTRMKGRRPYYSKKKNSGNKSYTGKGGKRRTTKS